jgi:ketosteroid isomerase-like protein
MARRFCRQTDGKRALRAGWCSHPSDRSFADACAVRHAVRVDRQSHHAAPEIEEVLVDGDTAVVRLVWTLTVTDASGTAIDVVREKGLDVFRRQPDGTWKIRISYAYPL